MKLAERILKKCADNSATLHAQISENVTNNELLSLAYITSKEGKLTNKKIHDYMMGQVDKKAYDALPKRGYAEDARKLSSVLESNNFHTLSLIVDLLNEKKTKHAEFALEIEKLHEKISSMPQWLSTMRFLVDTTKKNNGEKFRDGIIADMEKSAKKTGGRFGAGLDVTNKTLAPREFWSLLKKHPEKDIAKKVEEISKMEPPKAMHLTVTYRSSDKRERMAISNRFHDLGRKIRREMDDVGVDVNGPFEDAAAAKFGE